MSPVDDDFEGDGLQFIDQIKGGAIPKEFIPSVEKDSNKQCKMVF